MSLLALLLALLAGSALLLLAIRKDRRYDKKVRHLPGALPVIGNLITVVKDYYIHENTLQKFSNWSQQYGSFYITLPGIGMQLEISDPASIQHILNDNFDNYPNISQRQLIGRDIFGDGIFLADGPSWKVQRKLASPIFKVNSLKKMIPIFKRHTHRLLRVLDDWNTQSLELASREKGNALSLDIQELFKRFTLDTIGEIGFGVSVGSLDRPVEFSQLFDWTQEEIIKTFLIPMRKFVIYREWKSKINRMNDFVFDIIRRRKAEHQQKQETKKLLENNGDEKVVVAEEEEEEEFEDLLSHYLSMTDKKTGQPLSDEFLRDSLMNFFIAGRDTTALLLTWTFFHLSQYPEVEAKVLQELQTELPADFIQRLRLNQQGKEEVDGGEEEVENPEGDHQVLKGLRYLRMVLDETLRLYPPAMPHNTKVALREDVLPNGVRVQAGQNVGYCTFAVHHKREFWGVDADEFRPERWEDPGLIKHPYQFIPFQKGPRVCLGMDMAYQEVKLAIVMILMSGYRMRLLPGQKVQALDSITVPSKYGMRMTLVKV